MSQVKETAVPESSSEKGETFERVLANPSFVQIFKIGKKLEVVVKQ